MKKPICLILSMLLLISFAACSAKKSDKDFVWTRNGYFEDKDGNVCLITESEDQETYPGWGVTVIVDGQPHGWFIEQDGTTLHGNLTSEYEDGDDYIVTVSEEGETGITVAVEKGETYHFEAKEMPKAALTVTINIDGMGSGMIAYAKKGETIEFDNEFPSQSAYLGLEGPETYVFAAKANEGSKFVKWTKNGEDYSTDAEITVELTEDAEFLAVFEETEQN